MKRSTYLVCMVVLCASLAEAGITTNRFVVKDNSNAAEPYNTWDNAAPDIQTAIDAAVAENGDRVIVAPGVYDSGATWVAQINTRVAINKAITVISRDNDPATTIIRGAWDPVTTNGPQAVRCVLMTANAQLIGFTLTNGATASVTDSGDDGGGIYFSLSGNVVSNCVITRCSARYGGGVYGSSGTLFNCRLEANQAYRGGGSYNASLYNCIIRDNETIHLNTNNRGGGVFGGSAYNSLIEGNRSYSSGGARESTLYNCTIVNNTKGTAAGTRGCTLYNCISWNNIDFSDTVAYYSRGDSDAYLVNNCTQADPKFMDAAIGNWRLHGQSPCVDTATNLPWMATAVDLDGMPRLNGAPDMGCYEYVQRICHVAKDNPNAAFPYDSWETAAPDIQTALDAATMVDSDFVLVAPGVYDTGGMPYGDGSITNRIVIYPSITVRASDPDPAQTVIQGMADAASTNWAGARCVYMTKNTKLIGFTISGGAVPTNSVWSNQLINSDDQGGGVFCDGQNNEINACVLSDNMASFGGAVYSYEDQGATVRNCEMKGNQAYQGGGVMRTLVYNSIIRNNRTIPTDNNNRAGGLLFSTAYNCLVESNETYSAGGGAGRATIFYNCTLVNNLRNSSHTREGAGTRESTLYNSISWNNTDWSDTEAYFSCGQDVAIYTPENNCLTSDPLFTDTWHLRGQSPCINAGENAPWMLGTRDLAGNPRLDTVHKAVDMGCYEKLLNATTIICIR